MKNLFLLAFLGISFLSFAQNDSIVPGENNESDLYDLNQNPNDLDIIESTDNGALVGEDEIPQFLVGDRDKSEAAMMKYITEYIVYPQEALKKKIEGKVRVKFTVSGTGEILNVHSISKHKLGYGCEEEAIRVIKSMPKWKQPATHDGRPVSVYYTVPVKFRLH